MTNEDVWFQIRTWAWAMDHVAEVNGGSLHQHNEARRHFLHWRDEVGFPEPHRVHQVKIEGEWHCCISKEQADKVREHYKNFIESDFSEELGFQHWLDWKDEDLRLLLYGPRCLHYEDLPF